MLLASVAAWAYWSATAASGSQGAAVAATVAQGATPTASAAAGRKVTVSWGASTLSNGHAVAGYTVKRYDATTGALQSTLAGCAGTVAATTCVETAVPVGAWRYSVTPVIGTQWQGAEGLKSGIATVAAATLVLARTLFGAPLPQSTTGSLAGFAAGEGVSYRLDASTPLTGSPSSVGAAGTATISSLAIPATSDGPHTVYALGDAAPSASQASAAIVTDTTAPTVDAQLTPAASATGWNASSPVAVALVADDGSGSGIGAIRYTTDSTDPRSSGTAATYSTALSISADTTIRYVATDLAGNVSSVGSRLVRFDASAPVNVLSLSSVTGGAYLTGTTVYYRGTSAGSFTLTNALTDAGGAGAASSATTALTGTSTGWSHSPSTTATPAGGPYVSAAFDWSAATASSPGASVTGTDGAGNTTTTGLTFTPDTTVPGSAALTVNAVAATGAGSASGSSSGSFSIARTDFTDAGSGLASSILTLESAALSSAGGIAAGTCAAFGAASVVTGSPAQTVTGPTCYRYTLTGTDRVGNTAALSTIVKVDTTAPTAPVLTLSNATGNAYVSGSTVFINAQPTFAGSFQVAATSSDAQSGLQKLTFPALTDFASGGGDVSSSPYETTYSWSGSVGASGSQNVTATNTATGTATSSFTLTPDVTGPTGGALTVNGTPATGAGSESGSATGSFTIGTRTDYGADGSGSGVLSSQQLVVQSAALSSSDGIAAGTCATFGSATVVTGSPAQSVTGPNCYRYTLTGTDRVGNTSALSTVVKVDATAPSAPVLTVSAAAGNTFVSGSTVFISPLSANSGSFQVAAASSDPQSGIQKVNFPSLTGFAAGGGDDTSSPFTTTYSWSGAVTASGSQTVTATNVATGTATGSFTITPDVTGPAGGAALTVNGVAATGGGSVSTSSNGGFAITGRVDYSTDVGGAGFDTSQLTVQTAALSSTGITAGTCSTFGSATPISGSPAQTLTGPACYRYALTGTDRVGNTSSLSTVVQVDTSAPSAPALTLSGATGNTYVSGSTVTISPKAANSGSFQIAAVTTDADSGIQKVNFPALTGFSSGAGDDASSPFATTYNWTAAVGATGNQTVTATNNVGATTTSTFTVTPDITGPLLAGVVSKQQNGTTGNGKLEVGDQLLLTFGEPLRASNMPATFAGTEKRAGSLLTSLPDVQLDIPNVTEGILDTKDPHYLATGILCGVTCLAATASFTGSLALSPDGLTVTLTVATVTGDATATGSPATMSFKAATTFQDRVGNPGLGGALSLPSFLLF